MGFWMQDKNGDKDEENCNKFNEFARNPNQPPPNSALGMAGSDAWSNVLGLGARPDQPSHGFGGAVPGGTIPGMNMFGPRTRATPPQNSFGHLDLSSLLANSGLPPPPGTGTTAPMPAPPRSAGGITVEDMQRAMQGNNLGRQREGVQISIIFENRCIIVE